MSWTKEFLKGLIKENPVLVMLLGTCPTLAVTAMAQNGLGMGLATTFVLLGSSVVISLLKKVIPGQVRLPAYIVIIAGFVTLVSFLLQVYVPSLYDSLGVFLSLITVNCIILGRAEAFASRNGVIASLADGLGSGLGFTLALALVASVREIVGAGSLTVWGDLAFKNLNPGPATLAILPAGGFIVLGLLLALMNHLAAWKARRQGAPAPLPVSMDCRHCTLCGHGKEVAK